MKVTLDLSPELVREMKLKALLDGRKLKEIAEDSIRRGLLSTVAGAAVPIRQKIELPLFPCTPGAPASRMAAEDLLLMEQAALNQEDLERLGHSL